MELMRLRQRQWCLLMMILALAISCLSSKLASANNNITDILSNFPEYSTFSKLCSESGVAAQIYSRKTITVLAIPNSALDPIIQQYSPLTTQIMYDIVSYHVLLDYYDMPKIKAIHKGTTLTTTLYQTTGIVKGNQGSVNITDVKGGNVRIGLPDKGSPLTATVTGEVYTEPYNISVLSVSSALVPDGVAPGPAPPPINFTEILIEAKNYKTFLSLIQSTKVDLTMLKHDTPPGITIFAPDDAAFKKLPAGALANLTTDQTIALLEFHCLTNYYTAQELTTLNAAQDTLATDSTDGFKYKGITASSSKGGSAIIDTGYYKVKLGATLYSQLPLGLYGVHSVLMPTDIFGEAPPAPLTAAPAPAPAGTAHSLAASKSPPAPPNNSAHLRPCLQFSVSFIFLLFALLLFR